MDEDDDTQYMLAQDPGYLEWMEKQRTRYEGELMQEEHTKSLEDVLTQAEFEEGLRQDILYSHAEWLAEERYWAERDECWKQEDEDE